SAHLSTAEIVQELRFFDVAKWYADMQAQWELEWAQWEEEWQDWDWEDEYYEYEEDYYENWIWDDELQDWVLEGGYVEAVPPVIEIVPYVTAVG
ncbi:MAG: hypothetical protein FWD48_08295, partial [Oscillospiraceae bacterium]|nr:hypothetical protein [Oscillospiraceae bacterium]